MRVVELVRLSTEEQYGDGRVGILRQKEENKRTVDKHHLTIDHSIELIDVSGTSVMKTPEIKNLVKLMGEGRIQGVVISDVDRLLRLDDFRDLSLLQEFIDHNVLIYLPDNVIDLNTQSGFLFGGIQSIISGNELTQIKKRMLNAKEIKRKQGGHPNSDLSLPMGVGYNRKKESYYYNKDSLIVKEIFNLFYNKSIHNYRELERITGVKHRTIYNLLQNKLFIGVREYRYKRSNVKNIREDGRQGDRKKILRSEDEVISNIVINEPLIDQSVFQSVQIIIKNRREKYHIKRKNGNEKFLYSSFLRCGYCGSKIYSATGSGSHRDYYACSLKKSVSECASYYLRRELFDNTITHFISNELSSKIYLNKLINYVMSVIPDSIENKVNLLATELKSHQIKKEKLLDLYLDNIYSKNELEEKNQIISEKIRYLEIEIDQNKKILLSTDSNFIKRCLAIVSRMATGFSELSVTEKRKFIRETFPSFTLVKEGVKSFTLSVCALGSHIPVATLETRSVPAPVRRCRCSVIAAVYPAPCLIASTSISRSLRFRSRSCSANPRASLRQPFAAESTRQGLDNANALPPPPGSTATRR